MRSGWSSHRFCRSAAEARRLPQFGRQSREEMMAHDYSQYGGVLVARQDKVLTITLNAPETLNAFTGPMHTSMSRIWDDVNDDPDGWETGMPEAGRIVSRMLECDKPIIARVNGHAVGLGATVALLCDIIIAADHAKIGDPHVNAGLVAGDGGALIWPQLIGFARAKEYLLTGDLMTAAEAERIGLINHVVSADQLDEKVYGLARRLAGGAMRSIRWTKQAVNISLRQLAHSMMDLSLSLETQSNLSKDHREAVWAFTQKRRPSFAGR